MSKADWDAHFEGGKMVGLPNEVPGLTVSVAFAGDYDYAGGVLSNPKVVVKFDYKKDWSYFSITRARKLAAALMEMADYIEGVPQRPERKV